MTTPTPPTMQQIMDLVTKYSAELAAAAKADSAATIATLTKSVNAYKVQLTAAKAQVTSLTTENAKLKTQAQNMAATVLTLQNQINAMITEPIKPTI